MPVAIDDATNDVRRTPDGKRLYECDCCGKVSVWEDSWAWFGSYRQAEDFGLEGVSLVKTICSPDCRVQLVARGDLPADGLDDRGNVLQ